MKKIQISPSILSADFSQLGSEIKKLEEGGADLIHVDVMDGHFVPNLTIGPPVIKNLRKYTKLPFDVHLMISPVHEYIENYANAGADIITIHPEATKNLKESISLIKKFGKKVGVSLNPKTEIKTLIDEIDNIDLVLVMSVNPGFGGQKFMPEVLDKIRELKKIKDKGQYHFNIEVDGAIPDAISPGEYVICNPLNQTNTQIFDLSSQDQIILEGQNINNFEITYHISEDDALNGVNELESQYQNISNPQTVYARVESNNAYNCFSITSFDLAICLIPEGISPNNDGYNDRFELKGYDVKSLKIYNRYGKLVFSTTNYNDSWEGESNEGNKLPVGTYFYHMIYDDNLEKTGWIYVNY